MDAQRKANRSAWGSIVIVMAIVLVYSGAYFALVERSHSGLARYAKSKSLNGPLTSFFRPANGVDRRLRPDFWGQESDIERISIPIR